MTTKTGLSPAEQSRLAAKTALVRQAEEKQREEEAIEKTVKELDEKRRLEEEECKLHAAPISEKLYSLLREKIKEEENKGCKKLETYLGWLLTGLTCRGQKMLASHALNFAAKKLRDDGYRVQFGRPWSEKSYFDPYGSSDAFKLVEGTSWGEDVTSVPYRMHTDPYETRFTSFVIEIDWSGEESK